jgi:protein gp37
MSDHSSIEWTQATWNPVTGCDRVSPGCDHCYAASLAKRLKAMGNPRYQRDGGSATSGPGFGITLHPDQIELPRRWRRSRIVFVNSMSDLFHPKVPDHFIERVWNTMADTPQHTYQILTKRHQRLPRVVGRLVNRFDVLPNVWLGVSIEDQEWAERRVPRLLETPAAVRFLSCEPLLGPVDVRQFLQSQPDGDSPGPSIHWLIVGGESGHGHRPLDPQWARDLRDQCLGTGVAFFFKQVGGRTPKAGGRLLDGRTWDQMPSVTSSSSPAA